MTKVFIILFVALVLEAVGVVFLSAGLKEIGEAKKITVLEVTRLVRVGITNRKILLGVSMETVFFIFLIVLLKRNDVSLIWPLTSLGFVLTALSARFILHEQVTPMRWFGVALIVIGATLVSWSERRKPQGTPPAAPGASSLGAPLQ